MTPCRREAAFARVHSLGCAWHERVRADTPGRSRCPLLLVHLVLLVLEDLKFGLSLAFSFALSFALSLVLSLAP